MADPERSGPINVLFLSHSYPRFARDPVGSFVLRLAVALREENINVRVLAPAGPGVPVEEVQEGIPVRRFRYAPESWETLAYTGTMANQVRGSWRAKAALTGLLGAGYLAARAAARERNVDLLHAHWWFPSGLIASWLADRRLPMITTLHGSDLRVAREGTLGPRLLRRVLSRAAAVTTVSSWLAREVNERVPGVVPTVAPMPVVSELFHPGGTRERDRLLFVGKLTEQKGFDHLLAALRLMRHRPTVDVVVGVGSDQREGEARAEAAGVAGQLRWHPLLEQAQLADIYRRSTALVVPALEEGLGLTAVEALLCETPVVAFDSGGLPDSVVPQQTGLLVPPGDVAALAAALDELLGRADQGAALGRAGRLHALAHFAPSAVARRYADLYRRVLGRTRA